MLICSCSICIPMVRLGISRVVMGIPMGRCAFAYVMSINPSVRRFKDWMSHSVKAVIVLLAVCRRLSLFLCPFSLAARLLSHTHYISIFQCLNAYGLYLMF